ncbi:hypothetical protein QAD02_000557 [Eretmocerus hayati]|uniref:Uncharacterized protein n=1 Tax=Eretmocerus hayati TaxID=131215 RepID=A0ACC2NED9_9HYME|nr:hypothetical protein QAD02_000557 [Eretmocerus hayati]
MPRTRKSPKKTAIAEKSGAANNSSWVFIMKEGSLHSKDDAHPVLVKLRHPATNRASMYAFSPGDTDVQEVIAFKDDKRSWFVDDTVRSNGKMYFSTPVDPLFLILPYLQKSKQTMPLDQCLHDEDYPETYRLSTCQNAKLCLIADQKGSDSLKAFKYNEEKTLKWLQKKVERVSEVVKQKGVHVSQGAISANFVKSMKNMTGTQEEFAVYAYGIISQYLPKELSQKLRVHMNLPDESETKKRKPSSPNKATDEKKSKTEINQEPTQDEYFDTISAGKPVKAPTLTKKDLAMKKAAAGSKSITSFFMKK